MVMRILLALLPVILGRVIFEIDHFKQTPAFGPDCHNPLYYALDPAGTGNRLDDTTASISEAKKLVLNSSSYRKFFGNGQHMLARLSPEFRVKYHKYLVFKTTMSYVQTGVSSIVIENLFGDQVIDGNSDPRLASGSFIVRDLSGLGVALVLTNKMIYVGYINTTNASYIPVAERNSPFETVDLTIAFDPTENSVIFQVDDVIVYRLFNVGFMPSRQFVGKMGDPNEEGAAFFDEVVAGFSMESNLDYYPPCSSLAPFGFYKPCVFPLTQMGLVQFQNFTYVNPRDGCSPAEFVFPLVDDEVMPQSVLFGQGGIMTVCKVQVSEIPAEHCKMFAQEETVAKAANADEWFYDDTNSSSSLESSTTSSDASSSSKDSSN